MAKELTNYQGGNRVMIGNEMYDKTPVGDRIFFVNSDVSQVYKVLNKDGVQKQGQNPLVGLVNNEKTLREVRTNIEATKAEMELAGDELLEELL